MVGKCVLLAGFARGLGGFFGDVNVASWTDIFLWGVDNWGFSAGERHDVFVADRTREIGKYCDEGGAGRTGGVYLDIFGLGWLEPKERAVSANHSILGFYELPLRAARFVMCNFRLSGENFAVWLLVIFQAFFQPTIFVCLRIGYRFLTEWNEID